MKKLIPLILLVFSLLSCHKKIDLQNIDFRQEMRNFVQEISSYSKKKKPYFIVVPQNGQALITDTGEPSGKLDTAYIHSFDATGREDMFYGYNKDDEATPSEESNQLVALCQLCKKNGITVLATDYCSSHGNIDDSYEKNKQEGFVSFAAPDRALSVIPDYPARPFNENLDDITKISEAKNFLYIINPENYSTKEDFINALSATNYDVIIMDLFFNDGTEFTPPEIEQLKKKKNSSMRLVICYMSIGEAEDYRYYWHKDWSVGNPSWLEAENPNWKGNYKVRYWDQNWKDIIYGSSGAYLDRIINAGFDGVYLDIIDAYEYFEAKYPKK